MSANPATSTASHIRRLSAANAANSPHSITTAANSSSHESAAPAGLTRHGMPPSSTPRLPWLPSAQGSTRPAITKPTAAPKKASPVLWRIEEE